MAKIHLTFNNFKEKETREKSPLFANQLSDVILKKNILWFIKLRSIVIAMFMLFGIVSIIFSDYFLKIGIATPCYWPFGIAFILFIANLCFWLYATINSISKPLTPAGNIWLQILIDLLTLTAVVHFVGSTTTPAVFLYIIHIALSCIFFNWPSSLKVTLLASGLYISCIFLELTDVIPNTGLLKYSTNITPNVWYSVIWALSVVVIFLIVWFIVSRLSFIIRMREKQLISIQEDLKKIQTAKDQYAIQMTHQLKSPLDAMRSTIKLITKGYYGDTDKELKVVFERIEIRAKAMGDLILDVLRLARLLDPDKNKQAFETIDLADLLIKLISHLQTSSEPRGISFKTYIESAYFNAVPEQIQILLSNLLSNAVNYSFNEGTVTVKCYTDSAGSPVIIISDNGIGIPDDKLPNIFNEYFKTKEAMKHNPTSTGIGLSMVRRICEFYKINISVESEIKKGTTFTLTFPKA